VATPKKPSNRPKSSSSGAPKKPAARKTSASSAKSSAAKGKAPAKRSSSASARKTPAKTTRKASPKTARKTAPKSGSKAEARAAAASVPEIEGAKRTAATPKAVATKPSLKPGRSRSYGRWAAIGALVAGVVVVILLISSGGGDDNNNATVADTTPATTPTFPAATTPDVTTPSAVAAPVAKPVVRKENCDPIIGSGSANGGKTYPVTSSAKDGNPADCGEAHSVLLTALQGSGTTVGDWTCRTDPSGDPVASCTSTGGRSIQAAG
jgi:hypothetical protein